MFSFLTQESVFVHGSAFGIYYPESSPFRHTDPNLHPLKVYQLLCVASSLVSLLLPTPILSVCPHPASPSGPVQTVSQITRTIPRTSPSGSHLGLERELASPRGSPCLLPAPLRPHLPLLPALPSCPIRRTPCCASTPAPLPPRGLAPGLLAVSCSRAHVTRPLSSPGLHSSAFRNAWSVGLRKAWAC